MRNMCFCLKNEILHNYFFNRVWLETTITVKFALKNCIDSTTQTSKMFFLDPFREYFHFLTHIPMNFRVFGTPRTDFSATFGRRNPFPQARANKTMRISSIKPQKHPSLNHFFKNLLLSIPVLIDFINRH